MGEFLTPEQPGPYGENPIIYTDNNGKVESTFSQQLISALSSYDVEIDDNYQEVGPRVIQDNTAWSLFLESLDPFMTRVARHMTNGNGSLEAECDDIIQDSRIKLTKKLIYQDRYDAPIDWSNIAGLAAIITRNTALDAIRKEKKTFTVNAKTFVFDDAVYASRFSTLNASLGKNPLDHTLNNELGGDLVAAIMRLPMKLRDAVVSTAVLGLAYSDAANKLNIPLGTLKCRSFHGKAFVRDSLIEHRFKG